MSNAISSNGLFQCAEQYAESAVEHVAGAVANVVSAVEDTVGAMRDSGQAAEHTVEAAGLAAEGYAEQGVEGARSGLRGAATAVAKGFAKAATALGDGQTVRVREGKGDANAQRPSAQTFADAHAQLDEARQDFSDVGAEAVDALGQTAGAALNIGLAARDAAMAAATFEREALSAGALAGARASARVANDVRNPDQGKVRVEVDSH